MEGVILAAGKSSRTSPDCKLAFELAGQTLLERSIAGMNPFCTQIYVVTGAHADVVGSILHGREGMTLVHNPNFATGMYGSVKAGLRRTCADRVFLLPGDCPFVEAEVYAALLAAEGEILVPIWQEKAGHPVLLRRSVISELLQDNTFENLRQFIAAHQPIQIEVSCPGILVDIDTLEEYQQVLSQLPSTDDRRLKR